MKMIHESLSCKYSICWSVELATAMHTVFNSEPIILLLYIFNSLRFIFPLYEYPFQGYFLDYKAYVT